MIKEIIFFCPSIEDGGVEKNLFLIANKLSDNLKISVVTANENKKENFSKKINLIFPKNININNAHRLIKSFYCFFLMIKNYRGKNGVIISYESNVFAIIIAKLIGLSVIIRSNASPEGYLKNYLKNYIFKFFFKFADIILVNSSDFKKQIDEILNINSKLIYNSIVDTKTHLKVSTKKIKKYKLKHKCYKIVVIGRLVRQKDQITILRALNLLKTKLNFFVLIIGKGDRESDLKKFCISKNLSKNVKFLGYKKNIYPYLKWSDALILSSKYEGSPNVLIEAISMKKIVISSNCPTGPKEILKNGKAGYLFKTSDFKDLARKITFSFFNKKISNKKINYAQKTIKRYSISRNKNELNKIIKSLK